MGKHPANPHVRFWRDPDLSGVEVRYSRYAADTFRPHVHGTHSVGLIDTGAVTFLLEGATHEARAGQVALIPAGAVHACNPDPDMSYRMFYLDPCVAIELCGDDAQAVFATPVVDDAALFAAWAALYDTIVEGAGRLEKESLLVRALDALFSNSAATESPESPDRSPSHPSPGAVERARAHLEAHAAESIFLDDLARVAGLSPRRLLEVFQDAFGLPPHAYQNQLRVELAKGLLARGAPIAEAAAGAGFSDQSHLHRVFRRFTGATPGQYRAG